MEKDIVNWTERGFKPVVKNQRKECVMLCLSSIISAALYAKEKKNVDFSEQQLIDLFLEKNIRIFHEVIDQGIMNIMKNCWVTTSMNYPTVKNGEEYGEGIYDTNKVRPPFVEVLEMKQVIPKSDEPMEMTMMKLLEKHPIMVQMSMHGKIRLYKEGIFDTSNIFKVIVGYGESIDPKTDTKTKYWIVLQSLGNEWGNGGYMKIQKGRNICNIEEKVWYPILGRYEEE